MKRIKFIAPNGEEFWLIADHIVGCEYYKDRDGPRISRIVTTDGSAWFTRFSPEDVWGIIKASE